MNLVWSLPVRGEPLSSSRGDLVRARSLVEALRSEGHRVTVVEDHAAPAARARVATYRRIVRPLLPGTLAGAAREVGRLAHGRAHGRRVARAARLEGADLIFETQVHFAGSGALASRLSGVPLVLDDCSPWTEERSLGSPLPWLARAVFRAEARAAAYLVASSRQIRDLLVDEGVPGDRVHVVPNGVDTGASLRFERAGVRRRLGVEDRVVIGFVGSFQPWHRVDVLLEALRLAAEVPLHLLLIGDGPERARLESTIEALGLGDRVSLPGPLSGSDLAEALVACDIGALPASNEYGQPMKLLDYAAARLAIVAPDVPPVRDMLGSGATGLLVPNGDPGALAAALTRLARAPEERRRLGAAARISLASGADWRTRARTLIAATAPDPVGSGTLPTT